jgi:hypothetical protein
MDEDDIPDNWRDDPLKNTPPVRAAKVPNEKTRAAMEEARRIIQARLEALSE